MGEPIEFRVTLDEPIQFSLTTGPQGPVGEKGDKGDTGTTDYNQLENKPDLTTFYKKTEADERFVAKEEGKGLSSNDYTNAEKTKLEGIAEGAEKNLPVDTELSETSKNAVENKAITVAVNSKANQAEVDEISSDTEDILGALTTTDRGINLELKHTADAKIRDVKLFGDINQARYEGVNLLNIVQGNASNGIRSTITDNQIIKVVGKATGAIAYLTNGDENTILPAGTYKISLIRSNLPYQVFIDCQKLNNDYFFLKQLDKYDTTATVTITEALKKLKVGIKCAVNNTVDGRLKVQITKNNIVTGYEPYTGEQFSPNPNYPQKVKTVNGKNQIKVAGKNLLTAKPQNVTKHGLSFNSVVGTEIAINGTAERDVDFHIFGAWNNMGVDGSVKLTKGETYTGSLSISRPGLRLVVYGVKDEMFSEVCTVSNALSKTFTHNKDIYITDIFISIKAGTQFNNEILQIQLEKSPAPTSYEHNIDKTETINLAGKNLFAGTFRQGNVSQSTIPHRIFSAHSPLLEGGKTYTLSFANLPTDILFAVLLSDAPFYGLPNQNLVYDSSWQNTTWTITPNKDSYFGLIIKRSDGSNLTPEYVKNVLWNLEEGSVATGYQDYHAPIELCKLGDYQDRIFYDNGWKLEKKVDRIELTGDEDFEVNLGGDDENQCYAVSNQFNSIIADTEVLPFCSHFKTVNFSIENDYGTDTSIMSIKRSQAFGEAVKFMFSPNDTTRLNLFGVDKFRAWLKSQKNAGKPVTIIFVKTNPEVTEIADQNLITQLNALRKAKTHKGITNILPSCEIEVDTLVSAEWLRNK